tara:strand:- start:20 stop:1027 length:1008 start_codon:yes stop_codon:yes gene_type:complete
MAGILLRSPVYKTVTAPAPPAVPLSTKCTITIDSVLRYTLVKSTSAGATILWEIAELCRDYIETIPDIRPLGTFLPVVTVITTHVTTDGSGVAGSTDTFTDVGYDGYGTFLEGANPTISPDGNTPPNWLISGNPAQTLNNFYYSYVPTGAIGYIPYIDGSDELAYQLYTDATVTLTMAGSYNMNIVRIDCTKYGAGHRILFTNKYGAIQELWFFLKEVNTISKKQSKFQRNIITNTGTYLTVDHSKKVFNTVANAGLTLSSGYYPEWANEWFEQLLLSESVWLDSTAHNATTHRDNLTPLNVKKSSITKKTSLNDSLIEYTFEFDMAFDYINNVR